MNFSRIPLVATSVMVLSACQSIPNVGYHPVCSAPPCGNHELDMATAQRVVYVENHGWKTSLSKTGTQSMWL